MSKFSYLQRHKTLRTARMTLYQIDGAPVLELAHAGESNAPFLNEMLKRNRRMGGRALTATVLEATREEDRELYARHIVKSWPTAPLVDLDTRERAPFSEENVRDFLRELPNWMFDMVRAFAMDVSNFVDEGISEAPETGKD